MRTALAATWLDPRRDSTEAHPMDLAEFRIGAEFTSGGGRWRCTDIGSRVVTAIRVDRASITRRAEDGSTRTRDIHGEQAEADGWFDGPPYGAAEMVFDEYDQQGCEPA